MVSDQQLTNPRQGTASSPAWTIICIAQYFPPFESNAVLCGVVVGWLCLSLLHNTHTHTCSCTEVNGLVHIARLLYIDIYWYDEFILYRGIVTQPHD